MSERLGEVEMATALICVTSTKENRLISFPRVYSLSKTTTNVYIRVFFMQNIYRFSCYFRILVYNLQKNRGSATFTAETRTKFGRVFIFVQ